MVDITDQKRIEAALVSRPSACSCRPRSSRTPTTPSSSATREARITFWNTGASGCTAGRKRRRSAATSRAARPDDADLRDRDGTARRRASGKATWRSAGKTARRGGRQPPCSSKRAAPPASILEINRDVSDRKRAEEQRAEMMARLAVLLEVSESLSAAATPDEIVEILLEKGSAGARRVRRQRGACCRTTDARWRSSAHVGTRHGAPAFARLPLTVSTPLTDAIRTRTHRGGHRRRDGTRAIPPCAGPSAPRAVRSRPFPCVAAASSAPSASASRAGELNSRDSTFAALLARQAAQALERATCSSRSDAHTPRPSRPAASRTTSSPRSPTSCARR